MGRRYADLDSISRFLVWMLIALGMSAFGMSFYAVSQGQWLFALFFLLTCPMIIFVISLHIYAMTEPKEKENAGDK